MTEIEELVLNNPTPEYKVFYGKNINQMPKLFKDEDWREPATVSQIIEMKNKSSYSPEKFFRDSWWNSHFDTSDAIVYEPEGGIMIVRNPSLLRYFKEISPKNDLINGALKLSPEQYGSLNGEKISKDEIKNYVCLHSESDLMTRQQILDNPIWNYLFKYTPELLDEHLECIFKGEKQKNAMRIFIKPAPEEVPTLRLFNVRANTSDLYGIYPLDADNGRLVGVLWGMNRRESQLNRGKICLEMKKGIEELSDSHKKILKDSTKNISEDLEPTNHC